MHFPHLLSSFISLNTTISPFLYLNPIFHLSIHIDHPSVAFRAITFEIPTPLPPTLSVARSTAIDNSAAIHSNSDRDPENYNTTMSQSTTTMLGNAANLNGSVIGGKFDILPFPIDPHGHFGEFLEELEHREVCISGLVSVRMVAEVGGFPFDTSSDNPLL